MMVGEEDNGERYARGRLCVGIGWRKIYRHSENILWIDNDRLLGKKLMLVGKDVQGCMSSTLVSLVE